MPWLRGETLLAPVLGWFTEGFDTADLKEAKALLDNLTEPAIAAEGRNCFVAALLAMTVLLRSLRAERSNLMQVGLLRRCAPRNDMPHCRHCEQGEAIS